MSHNQALPRELSVPRNILPVVGTFSALFVFVYIFVYLHAKASTSWPSQEIGLEDELVASFMFFFSRV